MWRDSSAAGNRPRNPDADLPLVAFHAPGSVSIPGNHAHSARCGAAVALFRLGGYVGAAENTFRGCSESAEALAAGYAARFDLAVTVAACRACNTEAGSRSISMR